MRVLQYSEVPLLSVLILQRDIEMMSSVELGRLVYLAFQYTLLQLIWKSLSIKTKWKAFFKYKLCLKSIENEFI